MYSVRLECVMHAASVHPEPGSNSLIFCIAWALALTTSVCSLNLSVLLSYFSSIFSSKEFRSLFCLGSPKLVVFVVQFSRIPQPLSGTACLLYHSLPLPVNTFFIFFLVFCKKSILHIQKWHSNTPPSIDRFQKHSLPHPLPKTVHARVHTYNRLYPLSPLDTVW